MKGFVSLKLGVAAVVSALMVNSLSAYDTNPPFKLLEKNRDKKSKETVYNPAKDYNIFINYELGMHCVGFDIAYCCVIPPYNSIQAQAIKTSKKGALPKLLSPKDKVKLRYLTEDNTYSEGNKMKYWSVAKDVDGNGRMDDPGDNIANYVWKHLFIYKDLEGTIPKGATEKDRLHVGKEINVAIDAGPSGKHMAGGEMDYADESGSNVVFVDTLVDPVKNIPIVLTASHVWDALGLPLTAFYDSERTGTIRSITEKDFHPFQKSKVQLHDNKGNAITEDGKLVEYFGTNPVDIPNCYSCHSRNGVAAKMARSEGLNYSDREFNYWKKNYPDMSDYMARLSEGSINILSLHDKHHGTTFLSDYRDNASSGRLGKTGPVNCADCHGDNISGNLKEPRVGVTGYKAVKAKPLTEAIHGFHLAMVPMPDAAGRSQACQACHPTHWQDARQNGVDAPNAFIDSEGNANYSDQDVRVASGGCFLGRDAHTNPNAKPPFFLNEIGKHYYKTVSRKDEKGKDLSDGKIRGLYCTNCHNQLTQDLYKHDKIENAAQQKGQTLRNKTLREIIKVVAKGDKKKFQTHYTDPTSKGDNPIAKFYTEHKGQVLVKNAAKKGLKLVEWYKDGGAVPYEAASGGSDWWLSASEPHCADCHIAPFVESEGGKYFPVDQPKKYSLYRYSKAHGNLACQSCHESIHGLYSTTYNGSDDATVDPTTHAQALQYSPDGKYAGPVTCAACHQVNEKGVPVQLKGTKYAEDYWAAVTLMHNMRDGDQKLSVRDLLKKFPYKDAQKVVKTGWSAE